MNAIEKAREVVRLDRLITTLETRIERAKNRTPTVEVWTGGGGAESRFNIPLGREAILRILRKDLREAKKEMKVITG